MASEWVGATRQRCTVHFPRNVVARAPKHARALVSGVVRQILSQPDGEAAQEQLQRAVVTLLLRLPQVADVLVEAGADLLAPMDLPPAHWRPMRSARGLERLNREVARRLDVVGDLPAPGCSDALGWRAAGRAGRRVGNVAALFPRGVHGGAATQGPLADRDRSADFSGGGGPW